MIIRFADVDADAPQIIEGVWDFIARMDFKTYLPDREEDFEEWFLTILKSDPVDTLVAEKNGDVVAGLGLAFTPFLWNPAIVHADELFWWASPKAPPTAALALLRFALDWSRQVGGKRKVMATFKSLTSSPEAVGRIYERHGLRETETAYMGEL